MIQFYTITKSLYDDKKASSPSGLNSDSFYLIFDENNSKYQLAVGEKIVSGDELLIETSETAINNFNTNAVAGKAVYSAI
jgi:hypothetical protein